MLCLLLRLHDAQTHTFPQTCAFWVFWFFLLNEWSAGQQRSEKGNRWKSPYLVVFSIFVLQMKMLFHDGEVDGHSVWFGYQNKEINVEFQCKRNLCMTIFCCKKKKGKPWSLVDCLKNFLLKHKCLSALVWTPKNSWAAERKLGANPQIILWSK